MPRPAQPAIGSQSLDIPAATSAEAFGRYIPGRLVKESSGPAWHSIRLRLLEQAEDVPCFSVPAVAEPFLVRVSSGEAVIEERTPPGPWSGSRVGPGDLFLSAPGSGYDLRVRLLSLKPFVTVQALLNLPLLARASEEVFGDGAVVHLKDVSGLRDDFVSAVLAGLEQELLRNQPPSPLFITSASQSLAVHLVRNYSANASARRLTGGLPGHILRKVSDHLSAHIDDGFSLSRCARLAGMSACHFSRTFKQSTGLSPSQYLLNLRMEAARQLLRETSRSIVQIGLDVGYTSHSHFAQIFQRETGQTPSAYRRQA